MFPLLFPVPGFQLFCAGARN